MIKNLRLQNLKLPPNIFDANHFFAKTLNLIASMKPNIQLHKNLCVGLLFVFPWRNAAPNRSQREGQGSPKHKVEPKFRRFFFFFFHSLRKTNTLETGEKKSVMMCHR